MSRVERWWRPAPQRSVRPARVSQRSRNHGSGQDIDVAFDTGYECGRLDERKRSERRDEQIARLARAAAAAQEGDYSLLDEIAREQGLATVSGATDDLLDVADAAGVTPLADVDGGQLVDALEAWLAEQSDGEA